MDQVNWVIGIVRRLLIAFGIAPGTSSHVVPSQLIFEKGTFLATKLQSQSENPAHGRVCKGAWAPYVGPSVNNHSD